MTQNSHIDPLSEQNVDWESHIAFSALPYSGNDYDTECVCVVAFGDAFPGAASDGVHKNIISGERDLIIRVSHHGAEE